LASLLREIPILIELVLGAKKLEEVKFKVGSKGFSGS